MVLAVDILQRIINNKYQFELFTTAINTRTNNPVLRFVGCKAYEKLLRLHETQACVLVPKKFHEHELRKHVSSDLTIIPLETFMPEIFFVKEDFETVYQRLSFIQARFRTLVYDSSFLKCCFENIDYFEYMNKSQSVAAGARDQQHFRNILKKNRGQAGAIQSEVEKESIDDILAPYFERELTIQNLIQNCFYTPSNYTVEEEEEVREMNNA